MIWKKVVSEGWCKESRDNLAVQVTSDLLRTTFWASKHSS